MRIAIFSERELQQLYASADIFAFPSPNETFGIAALEAMASGLPVVGVNSGGLAQLVVNGENGLLYEKANVNELAEHLQLLASNSSLRQKLGIGAREYAQQFTWQQSCTDLLAAYYQVLPRVKVT